MKKTMKITFLISFIMFSLCGFITVSAQNQLVAPSPTVTETTPKDKNIAFIVHRDNPISEISKETVALYYLKKVKFWPNNQSVRFFDRSDESNERTYFLNNFLSMSPREVDSFWIGQKLYAGDSAPTQVNDDNTMVRLVSKFPESIGYVSSGFVEAKGVKKITIIGK